MLRAGAIVLAVAALIPTAAEACLPDLRALNDDPFSYFVSVVNSLGWAKDGLAKDSKKGANTTDLLFNLKSARDDYLCAGRILAPFVESKDETIKLTAQALVTAYNNIATANEVTENEVVSMLDRASDGHTPGPGTVAELMAVLRQNRDGAWSDLLTAAGLASHALVSYEGGKSTKVLRITKAQRRTLKRQLEERFGPSIRKGPQTGQTYLLAAAGLLYEFLGSQKWRSSDEV